MIEIWKDIKEYENLYQVSSLGRVKSLSKVVNYIDGRKRRYKEIYLKPRFGKDRYPFVSLYKKNDLGNEKHIRIHQLVAKYFIPNPENKPCVNHKNGNRWDFNIENLEWCTHKENTQDGIKRGSIYKPGKKIDEKKAKAIRDLWNIGEMTQKRIGELFNLKQAQICRIVNYSNWK
jgi:hypothetical protein